MSIAFELDRKQLVSALARVNSVTYKKCTRELLKNCVLSVCDGVASFIANSVENFLVETVAAETSGGTLSRTMSPHDLAAVVKKSKAARVSLKVDAGGVVVDGARVPCCELSIDAAEFFAASQYAKLETAAFASVEAGELRGALLRANTATDTESSRYALAGVRIELPNDGQPCFLRFIGTDGRRLSVTTISREHVANNAPAVGAIVDRKTIERVCAMLKAGATAKIEILSAPATNAATGEVAAATDYPAAVRFSVFNKVGALVSVMTARVIEGRYPNWAQVIDIEKRDKAAATFCPADLLPLVESAGVGAVPTDDNDNRATTFLFRSNL